MAQVEKVVLVSFLDVSVGSLLFLHGAQVFFFILPGLLSFDLVPFAI